jgi:hypothetical protein
MKTTAKKNEAPRPINLVVKPCDGQAQPFVTPGMMYDKA